MRIYLSSGIIERHVRAWNECQVKNGLISYWFIKVYPDIFDQLYTLESVMIDSGVYTFLKQPKILQKNFGTKDPKKAVIIYTEEYVKWLRENAHLWDYAVEMDLYPIFGKEFIYELQKKYFKPLQRETGKKIIYVLHQHGNDNWNDLIYDDEVQFLAFGSMVNMSYDQYNYWISKCYKQGKLVHGFGITKLEALLKIPFATVDSTTWMSSDKYGEHFYFDEKNIKLKRIYARNPKDLFKYYVNGMSKYSFEDLTQRYQNDARLFFAIQQFQKIESFCTGVWDARGIKYNF